MAGILKMMACNFKVALYISQFLADFMPKSHISNTGNDGTLSFRNFIMMAEFP
jgi:hypothetical protein